MRKWMSILLVLLLFLTSGCTLLQKDTEGPPQNEDRLPQPPVNLPNLRETVLYLPDKTWQLLVPVRVYIPWEEGIAKATLQYCTEGYLPSTVASLGFKPLLPAGTTVLGLSVRDGLARVDFSEEFLSYPPEYERFIINGLTYTLTEFSTISKVETLVENEHPLLPGDTATDEPFTREFGLNLEISSDVDDFAQTQRVVLYFLYELDDRIFYVPVSRVVKEPEDWLKAVAEELLRGPVLGGTLFSAVPRGLTLQNVQVQGSKVILRLSGQVAVGGGQVAVDRFRHQLGLTFTDINGITEVEVLLDGELPNFGPDITFPTSFGRPKQWNLVE
ncbi:MAG: GerMN domain-containing protein [Firmicutes bacterium]|nr:GerMN domain-containing protein [Bacillota bacterium]